MTSPTVISVQNVSKRFVLHKDKSVKERVLNFARSKAHREEFWALRNIDLEIPMGSTIGLVGHNGSGKSTLLKAIGGIIDPTQGVVRRRGRMAALLELGAGFHPDLTGRENVYLNAALLGLRKEETARHFDEIVDFSGIEDFIDTQVKFYSSGMYVRLAFAVAVHVDPDIILVDEVLAVGDEPFQRKCMDKIAEFQSEGRTIVLVSHSSEQVGRLCDRVVVMDSGEMRFQGDPAEGIRILRDGYEADERAHASLEGPKAGVPYSLAGVTARTTPRGAGTDVALTITVDIQQPRPDWGLGISIENTVGLRVYGLATFELGLDLPNTVGRHTINVALPDVRLGSGKYLVNVGVGDNSGHTFDRRANVTSFDIFDSGIGDGVLALRPAFTFDEER